jgi:hypothetical protein
VAPPPELYLDMRGTPPNGPFIAVRTTGDPLALVDTIRRVARDADSTLVLSDFHTMSDLRSASLAERRFVLTLVSGFGVLALLLAVVGVYGVLALVVAERTSEMGLRMALGAAPATVVRLVLGQALRLAAVGIGVGLSRSRRRQPSRAACSGRHGLRPGHLPVRARGAPGRCGAGGPGAGAARHEGRSCPGAARLISGGHTNAERPRALDGGRARRRTGRIAQVTQRHLVAVCLDAAPVRKARGRGTPAPRRWRSRSRCGISRAPVSPTRRPATRPSHSRLKPGTATRSRCVRRLRRSRGGCGRRGDPGGARSHG